MNDNNGNNKNTALVSGATESTGSAIDKPVSRRQSLFALATVLGGAALAESAYADFVRRLLGGGGRAFIDKTVDPSSSLLLANGENGKYVMRTNGLPDHETGPFPNPNCPGAILPIHRVLTFPRNPQMAEKLTPLNGWLFGVALNGVIFDPTGPFWKQKASTGWHFEVMSEVARKYLGLDFNNAHTQMSGEYHYHGRCTLLQARLEALLRERGQASRMVLLGFAADGFPIYAPYGPSDPMNLASPRVALRSSYRLKSGPRPAGAPAGNHDGTFVQDYEFVEGLGQLDQCNGRFGVTDEYPQGTYYYVLTDEFPFVPRFYRGTPDGSFSRPFTGDEAPVPGKLREIYG